MAKISAITRNLECAGHRAIDRGLINHVRIASEKIYLKSDSRLASRVESPAILEDILYTIDK
jgi:hypothetical protein